MRAQWLMAVLMVFGSMPALAQEKFYLFPQYVDGSFPDGTSYRSTLMVQQWLSTGPINCTLRLWGMTSTFAGAPSGSLVSVTIPKDGWVQLRTTGAQPLQSGYAALTCSDYVWANLAYAYYDASGGKIGEATVFGVAPYYRFRLIADQTSGARVGIAIANDSDIQQNYTLTLRRGDGTIFSTTPLSLGPRQALPRFLNELVPNSLNEVFEVELRTTNFADASAVVGLRFTGTIFTTIPAN